MTEMTEYAHGQFSWVDLMAHDIEKAKAFYGSLFGWTATDQDTQGGPPYVMFRLDGHDVAGMGQMNDEMKSQGVPPIWNSYVNVDEVNAATEKATELGGTVIMPPMQVLSAGSMAIIQDSTGAMLSLWQKNEHIGARLVNVPGTFSWNELATRDVEKAREFFGKLFGWTFEDNPHAQSKYYVIMNGERQNGGMLQMDENWGDMPPYWGVYFTVDNCATAVDKVGQLGGRTIMPPFDLPFGRIAVVQDDQGSAFSLFEFNENADIPE